nr:unnamed protein product [Callosobruchus analis]
MGGGIAFYVKNHFSCRKIQIEPFTDEFKYLFLEIKLITEPTRVRYQSTTLIDPIFVSEPVSVISSGLINADMISDHH